MTKNLSFCAIGLALALQLNASKVLAMDSFDAREYTCSELKSLVQEAGEVIIENWAGRDEYFADPSQCVIPDTRPVFSYTPSEDTMFCGAGYTCAPLYPQAASSELGSVTKKSPGSSALPGVD